MTHAGQSGNRRWYDEEPRIGKAIEQILTFPDSLQELLCTTLLSYVEDEERQQQLTEQLHSMGSHKVLSLYKATLRRRAYDQQSLTRDTINGMGVLPVESQHKVAEHIFALTRVVVRYLKLCSQYQQVPKGDSVSHLFQLYRSGSHTSVENALSQMEARLKRQVQHPRIPSVPHYTPRQSPKISVDADRLES